MTGRELPLNNKTISKIPADVQTPQYDRAAVKSGIVHFGPGAFFRAHLASYADDLLEQGHMDCGITAVSLTSRKFRDRLISQDYLYTLHQRDKTSSHTRVIGSLKDILIAPEDPKQVIELMASPDTKLVTLTVTQKGYHFSPNGGLDFECKDIKDSLENSDAPKAAVAFLVAALQKRKERHLPPFSVMSCDNVTNNSEKLKQTVLAYAGIKSKELRHWIEENVKFPNTMVDRITPVWDQAHTDEIKLNYGYEDKLPVFTEPFKQLVIDRTQAVNIPPFNKVGAQYVEDVAPYELAKIRLLNGAHMALGIMQKPGVFEYAHEAMANPAIRTHMKNYMDEVKQTLTPMEGFDADAYIEGLFARLDNHHMKDELWRLARNGVSKLESRFLDPLKDAIAQKLPRKHIVGAIADWINYLQKADPTCEVKEGFSIEDPEAYSKGLVAVAKTLDRKDVTPMLAFEGVWGPLSGDRIFAAELQEAYIARNGGFNSLAPVNSSVVNTAPVRQAFNSREKSIPVPG